MKIDLKITRSTSKTGMNGLPKFTDKAIVRTKIDILKFEIVPREKAVLFLPSANKVEIPGIFSFKNVYDELRIIINDGSWVPGKELKGGTIE